MSIQGPVSLYIIHGHHIRQKEVRYIFFYSYSKGDTCQFRHEPAALTNETVSARSWSVNRGRDSPAKSAWPPEEIMTMRDERERKREREGGKNGEKGEKGGWEERKE